MHIAVGRRAIERLLLGQAVAVMEAARADRAHALSALAPPRSKPTSIHRRRYVVVVATPLRRGRRYVSLRRRRRYVVTTASSSLRDRRCDVVAIATS